MTLEKEKRHWFILAANYKFKNLNIYMVWCVRRTQMRKIGQFYARFLKPRAPCPILFFKFLQALWVVEKKGFMHQKQTKKNMFLYIIMENNKIIIYV